MVMQRVRGTLLVIETFVALTAIGGAIALIGGLEGGRFPVALLRATPFSSYVIPGIILAALVGGSASLAAATTARRLQIGALASLLAGVVLMGWIVSEIVLLAQPSAPTAFEVLYFILGLNMVGLGWWSARQATQLEQGGNADSAAGATNPLGFWSAILTAGMAALTFGVAISTPPRSGPFCLAGPCITYPYTEVAAFVPNDYLWMFPALLVGPLFIILVAAIHQAAPSGRKLCGQIAFAFAAISATILVTNYFIQLTVMQPSLLQGESAALSLFSQYNPHGIFIALEDIGYLMMSVAFFFVAAIFVGRSWLERAIRWIFNASATLAIGAFVVEGLLYRENLEYRFEVTVLTLDWSALIVTGVLLGFFFLRPHPMPQGERYSSERY